LHVEKRKRGKRGREKRRRKKKNAAEARKAKGVWPTAQLWRREGKGTRLHSITRRGKEENVDNGKEARENSPSPRSRSSCIELHAARHVRTHSDPNRFLQACSWSVGSDPEPARHV